MKKLEAQPELPLGSEEDRILKDALDMEEQGMDTPTALDTSLRQHQKDPEKDTELRLSIMGRIPEEKRLRKMAQFLPKGIESDEY